MSLFEFVPNSYAVKKFSLPDAGRPAYQGKTGLDAVESALGKERTERHLSTQDPLRGKGLHWSAELRIVENPDEAYLHPNRAVFRTIGTITQLEP